MESHDFNWLLKFLVNNKSRVNVVETYCFNGEKLDNAITSSRKGNIKTKKLMKHVGTPSLVLSYLLET
jgi:hypothetical protein